MLALLRTLKRVYLKHRPEQSHSELSAQKPAHDLLVAIDRGGIPLNPMIINRIGRDLGLKISASDPMSSTIARIRQVLR